MSRLLTFYILFLGSFVYSQNVDNNNLRDEDSLLSTQQELKINKIISENFHSDNISVRIILSSNYYPYNDPITYGNYYLSNKPTPFKKSILIIISKDVKRVEILTTGIDASKVLEYGKLKNEVLIPHLGKEAYYKGIKEVLKRLKN
jgi:hypothetical protein